MKVNFKNLVKEFKTIKRSITVLKGIDLTIHDGEFFVLLGPSGCGKSTLLNLVAGLEEATAGEIWLGDKLVDKPSQKTFVPPKKRNIAMVFQSYALYPHLNVYDNIAFPLRIEKMEKTEIDQRVREAATTLEIENLLYSKPKEMSGGQRQRVAIARAVVRHPSIFLLDEPLSNLDAQLRMSMRVELKKLQQRLGVTTLYVTHDQTEAMTLGDRIALLRDGDIEQVGTPFELYHQPRTAFVGSFVGTPQMNLIKVERRAGTDTDKIAIGNQLIKVPTSHQDQINAAAATQLTLGMRPEWIQILSEPNPESLSAQIESIETLGRESLLHLQVDHQKITALTEKTTLHAGETLNIQLNMDKGHFFN